MNYAIISIILFQDFVCLLVLVVVLCGHTPACIGVYKHVEGRGWPWVPLLRYCAPCYFESGSLVGLQLTMQVSLSWLVSSGDLPFSVLPSTGITCAGTMFALVGLKLSSSSNLLLRYLSSLLVVVFFFFQFPKLHPCQSYKADIISDGEHLEHLMILVWHL